jgi:hypothetical protein
MFGYMATTTTAAAAAAKYLLAACPQSLATGQPFEPP